jgi:hypothetical protein
MLLLVTSPVSFQMLANTADVSIGFVINPDIHFESSLFLGLHPVEMHLTGSLAN